MAINFEAANMAGYNNPKIEVFKAVVNPDNDTIISAPSKTEIKSCMNRGAIPLMLLTYPDGSAVYVLRLHIMMPSAEGDTIYFSNGTMVLLYSPDSEQPTMGAGG